FETLVDTVSSQHKKAKSSVEGDPRTVMDAAPHRATETASNMYRRAIVGGAAISGYGEAVSEFNAKVAAWNQDLARMDDTEKRLDRYKELSSRYTAAEEVLTDASHAARKQLAHWDSDAVLRTLWAAGALPIEARAMFPDAGLRLGDLSAL